MDIKKILLGLGVFGGGGLVLEGVMVPNSPVPLDLGEAKVSIHLPTLNEEGWIRETLESLVNQPLYKAGRVKLVVLDSHSTDGTRGIAAEYTDNVWLVPRGKLSARDHGFKMDDADIVVSVDAGDFYPRGWLSRLLKPFEDPDVVATQGPFFSRDPLWRTQTAWYSLIRVKAKRIWGRNSAVRTSAYEAMGGFDLTINQLDRWAMVMEEEMRFFRELEKIGKVVYVLRAGMYKTERERAVTLEDGRIPRYTMEREKKIRF